MKRLLFYMTLVLLVGCGSKPPQDVIAHVGSYVITREEFEEGYKNSSFSLKDTPDSRRSFLNNMINQKLILLDAQKKGLDKNKAFLKMVENFWQQSLMTVTLQEKTKEGGNLDQWVEYLKSNTKIEINEESLK